MVLYSVLLMFTMGFIRYVKYIKSVIDDYSVLNVLMLMDLSQSMYSGSGH